MQIRNVFLDINKKIIIVFLLIVFSFSVSAQQIITIGNDSINNEEIPLAGYYDYSWSSMIYKQSEMQGNIGSIESISFYISNTFANYSAFNQKVYMAVISDSTFSDSLYVDPISLNATLVYDDSLLWSSNNGGWKTINLSTPFIYLGGELLILWENRDGSWSSDYPIFRQTTSPEPKMTKNKSDDNTFPISHGLYSNTRPNIKIEFSPLNENNIRINRLVSPDSNSLPNANNTISIEIENHGSFPQDSILLQYSIDSGMSFVSEIYLNTLMPFDTVVYSFIATADMSRINEYNCIFIVNNVGDTINEDDTLKIDLWKGDVFTGDYSIGKDSVSDFNTINSAFRALENFGVDSITNLILSTDTFNEQVILKKSILGSSSSNTINLIGNNDGVITYSPDSLNHSVFSLKNSSHIILNNLKIVSTDSIYNCGIRIIASDSIVIENCKIYVPKDNNSSTTNGIVISNTNTDFSPTSANSIIINNNEINGGYYSIGLYGKAINHSYDIKISNNKLHDYYFYGIYSKNQDSVSINDNIISDRGESNDGYAIFVSENNNGTKVFNNNVVSNYLLNGYGIYIYYCLGEFDNPIKIFNNMVVSSNATNAPNGIFSYYGKNIEYYYNSVRINNGGVNSKSLCLNGSTTDTNFTNIRFQNNIFVNNGNGYAIYFEDDFFPNKVTVCDYNNLYSTGQKFAHYITDKQDLQAWQQSSINIDSMSLSVDPEFVDSIDLHTFSILLDGKADPVSSVYFDIDGEIRDHPFPDIGADEFIPTDIDVGVIKIMSKLNPYCSVSVDSIYVVVKNFGKLDQYYVGVQLAITSDLGMFVINDTVSFLPSNYTDTLLLGFVGINTPSIYNYTAFTSLVSDTVNSNDTTVFELEYFGPQAIGYMEDYFQWPPLMWDTVLNSDFNWQQYDSSIVFANFNETLDENICEFASPSISIPLLDTSYLGFQYSYANLNSKNDSLEVLYKTCNSLEWISLWKNGGDSLKTNNGNDTICGDFNDVLIQMPDSVMGEDVRIMFRGISNSGSNLFLNGMSVFMPYTFNLGNDTMLCEGSSYSIGIDDTLFAASYIWRIEVDTISIEKTVVVDTTATYILEVTQFGFVSYDTINTLYSPYPIVDLGNDTAILWATGSITLDAGNPGASYLWSTGDVSQTVFFDSTNLTTPYDNIIWANVTKNLCSTTDTIIITTIVISINDNKNDDIIVNVYPNPSNGIFNVDVNDIKNSLIVEIYDFSGKEVVRKNIERSYPDHINMDVRYLPNGVYFMKIQSGSFLTVKKIIIK